MDFKKIVIVLLVLIFVATLVLFKQDKNSDNISSKQSVILSTFALYDISKFIAKDKFEISTVLPFGSDAHSFELTPKKMAQIQDADLFVYSGAALEPWVSKFSSQKSLDMSLHVELIHMQDDEHHHSHHEHEDEEAVDPHYWLDLKNMQKMADVLTDEFTKLSPDNKNFFETNKKEYVSKLADMDKRYEQEFKECKKDTIVVNHNAFSYLGKKYSFHIESINGLSNDSMPSPSVIKDILHVIEHEKISVIFFESFASDKLIKSIAKDANVKVDTLQPLGNITKDEKDLTYFQIMDENIKKIKQALECR